jgi:predicted acetyltransferase
VDDLELRPVTDEEFAAYTASLESAFGFTNDAEDLEGWRSITDLDRTIGVFDDGRVVATAGAFNFDMTLPGGAAVPVAGVTAVSVSTTHRRRGLLRRMMTHQLDDVVARGESMAILTASETSIYGRFGYGLANLHATWRIAARGAALRPGCEGDDRVSLVDKETALKLLPEVYEAYRLQQPGALTRTAVWWAHHLRDREKDRRGASAEFRAVHTGPDGQVDGYALYRIHPKWSDGLPDGKVVVSELVGATPDAEASLFAFVTSVDLVSRVELLLRPVDDHLRWRLVDARQLTANHVGDFLWVRILDVPAALSARTLGGDAAIVIEVRDAFRPQTAGRYRVAPDGCTATEAPADLVLGIEELGALYLGGVSASTLARAGRIERAEPGALTTADALFASDPPPNCVTHF